MTRGMTEAGTTTVTARVAFATKEQLAALKPLLKADRQRAQALSTSPP